MKDIQKNDVKKFVDFFMSTVVDFMSTVVEEKPKKAYFYNYRSLAVCLIDCVYSLRVKYEPVTKNVLNQYGENFLDGRENIYKSEEKISDLIKHIEECGGASGFADKIKDHHKLGYNAIRKEDVVYAVAKYLRKLGIETMSDFINFEYKEMLEGVLFSVEGLGEAGVDYLFMLAGDENRCKNDVHIRTAVKQALGKDLSRKKVQNLFREVVREYNEKDSFKNKPLNVRQLDSILWEYYRDRTV